MTGDIKQTLDGWTCAANYEIKPHGFWRKRQVLKIEWIELEGERDKCSPTPPELYCDGVKCYFRSTKGTP